jgi:hypothetical protein
LNPYDPLCSVLSMELLQFYYSHATTHHECRIRQFPSS